MILFFWGKEYKWFDAYYFSSFCKNNLPIFCVILRLTNYTNLVKWYYIELQLTIQS